MARGAKTGNDVLFRIFRTPALSSVVAYGNAGPPIYHALGLVAAGGCMLEKIRRLLDVA